MLDLSLGETTPHPHPFLSFNQLLNELNKDRRHVAISRISLEKNKSSIL